MQLNPEQAVLKARQLALKNEREFMERWGEFPSALPQGISPPQQEQEQPFNQSENPALGGISPEGRLPGASDRVTATGQDSFGNDA